MQFFGALSPMICFLLVHHLDDVIKMAFQKAKNNNNCFIMVLNYITQKRNIMKMMKIMLNDKICIELYHYALLISFS